MNLRFVAEVSVVAVAVVVAADLVEEVLGEVGVGNSFEMEVVVVLGEVEVGNSSGLVEVVPGVVGGNNSFGVEEVLGVVEDNMTFFCFTLN